MAKPSVSPTPVEVELQSLKTHLDDTVIPQLAKLERVASCARALLLAGREGGDVHEATLRLIEALYSAHHPL